MKVQGVVLAGGEGRRLRPLTFYFQKAMVPVGRSQRPLLELVLRCLRYHGIDDVLLLVGYKHEQVIGYFGDGSRLGLKLRYVVDKEGYRGTGGALLNALHEGAVSADTLLVYYGDILTTMDLAEFLREHERKKADLTLAVARRYQVPVGVVELAEDGSVRSVKEKPWVDLRVTIGVLAVNREALRVLDSIWKGGKREIDIMGDFVPELVRRGYRVRAYETESFWYDVGSSERYEKLDHDMIDSMFSYVLHD